MCFIYRLSIRTDHIDFSPRVCTYKHEFKPQPLFLGSRQGTDPSEDLLSKWEQKESRGGESWALRILCGPSSCIYCKQSDATDDIQTYSCTVRGKQSTAPYHDSINSLVALKACGYISRMTSLLRILLSLHGGLSYQCTGVRWYCWGVALFPVQYIKPMLAHVWPLFCNTAPFSGRCFGHSNEVLIAWLCYSR